MGLVYQEMLQFRDSVMAWVDQRLAQRFPGPKYGVTQEIYAKNSGFISVLLNGETTPNPVAVGHVVPGPIGTVVKIDGPVSNRQITDVVTPYGASLYVAGLEGKASYYHDNGSTAYSAATDTDKWQQYTTSGTLNGGGTGITFSGPIQYRVSYDRIVDLRFDITFNKATTTPSFKIAMNMPVQIQPEVTNFSNDLLIRFVCQCVGGPVGSLALSNILGGTGDNLYILPSVAGVSRILGSFMYSLIKPTF